MKTEKAIRNLLKNMQRLIDHECPNPILPGIPCIECQRGMAVSGIITPVLRWILDENAEFDRTEEALASQFAEK